MYLCSHIYTSINIYIRNIHKSFFFVRPTFGRMFSSLRSTHQDVLDTLPKMEGRFTPTKAVTQPRGRRSPNFGSEFSKGSLPDPQNDWNIHFRLRSYMYIYIYIYSKLPTPRISKKLPWIFGGSKQNCQFSFLRALFGDWQFDMK